MATSEASVAAAKPRDSRIAQVIDALAAYVPGWPRRAPRFVTEQGHRVHGIIAEFADPTAVYHAAERVRDAGYNRWDVHSPFPIHGIEEAMGVKRTILPVIVLAVALSGAVGGLLLQWWISGVDYVLVDQGKPQGAWEQFTPIVFELGVLPAAFAALIGMLALNGLPRWHHPLFSSERFLRSSDDTFIIGIEADDPAFDPDAARTLLESAGATAIEVIEDED